MSAVVFAGTGSSTGASVIAPCVNRIVPIMIDCANNPGILYNFGIAVAIAEVFTAISASPVCLVTHHGAGGCLGLGLGQAVGEEIPVFCTAEVALCLLGAGSRPTGVMVAVQGTVIGQGTPFLHRNGAVVGQSLSIRHGEAGPIPDGQGLARADGEVVLQGDGTVHGADTAVKDDTASIITRWCRRRKRFQNF